MICGRETTTFRLEVFADYFQILIHDEINDVDMSCIWTESNLRNMVVEDDGALGIVSARNMSVPVDILFQEKEPPVALDGWDHIVSCGIRLDTGVMVVRGPSDYLPDAQRVIVAPGYYAARVSISGFASISDDGLDGEDIYCVSLWPSIQERALEVVKAGYN